MTTEVGPVEGLVRGIFRTNYFAMLDICKRGGPSTSLEPDENEQLSFQAYAPHFNFKLIA